MEFLLEKEGPTDRKKHRRLVYFQSRYIIDSMDVFCFFFSRIEMDQLLLIYPFHATYKCMDLSQVCKLPLRGLLSYQY